MTTTSTHPVLADGREELLTDLLTTAAPSGFEGPVRELVSGWGARFADVEQDRMGNAFVRVNRGAGRRIGLMAHMDEIGFIATRIDKPGVIRVQPIGGWDWTVPVGQRVRVLTADGPVPGVLTRLPIHQLGEKQERCTEANELWVDIGAADTERVEAQVRPGDPIVLEGDPCITADARLISRALDDRIGVFAVLEAVRRANGGPNETVAVLTTREEITLFGAEGATWHEPFDEVIVVDVTPASDVPGDVHTDDSLLGKGPIVNFGGVTNLRLTRQLLRLADSLGSGHQTNASGRSTGTEADAVMPQNGGTPVGLLTLAMRNLHTPGEIVALDDVEALIELLVAWASR